MAELAPVGLAIGPMTSGEILLCGRRWEPDEIAFPVFLRSATIRGLDEEIMRRFAGVRGALRPEGERIPDNGPLIAATTLHHDPTLVARKLRHLHRVPNPRLYRNPSRGLESTHGVYSSPLAC